MNKKIIILTIFIIIGMIVLPTIYKININHHNNLIKVVEKEFLYEANLCYNSNKCNKKVVTLKELYEKKFLTTKLTNPLTKKYYSEDSTVNIDTLKVNLLD